MRHLSETDTADAKFSHVTARPSTDSTSEVLADFESRLLRSLDDEALLGHMYLSPGAPPTDEGNGVTRGPQVFRGRIAPQRAHALGPFSSGAGPKVGSAMIEGSPRA